MSTYKNYYTFLEQFNEELKCLMKAVLSGMSQDRCPLHLLCFEAHLLCLHKVINSDCPHLNRLALEGNSVWKFSECIEHSELEVKKFWDSAAVKEYWYSIFKEDKPSSNWNIILLNDARRIPFIIMEKYSKLVNDYKLPYKFTIVFIQLAIFYEQRINAGLFENPYSFSYTVEELCKDIRNMNYHALKNDFPDFMKMQFDFLAFTNEKACYDLHLLGRSLGEHAAIEQAFE